MLFVEPLQQITDRQKPMGGLMVQDGAYSVLTGLRAGPIGYGCKLLGNRLPRIGSPEKFATDPFTPAGLTSLRSYLDIKTGKNISLGPH